MSWAILPGSSLEGGAAANSASSDDDGPPDAKHYLEGIWSSEDEGGAAGSENGAADGGADGGVDAATLSEDEQEAPTPGSARKGRARRYFTDREESRAAANRRVRLACFLCGSGKHLVADCPNELCFICLKTGHQSRDCPTDGRAIVCGSCSRLGHEMRSCPEPTIRPAGFELCRCIACGDRGHLDCTPFEKRPKQLSCFNCGAIGHGAVTCPRDGLDRWHRLFAAARALHSWPQPGGDERGGDGSSAGGKGASNGTPGRRLGRGGRAAAARGRGSSSLQWGETGRRGGHKGRGSQKGLGAQRGRGRHQGRGFTTNKHMRFNFS